jgi:hypothetical protein
MELTFSPALYQHQTTRHAHLIRAFRWAISRNGKDEVFFFAANRIPSPHGATPATFLVRCEGLGCSLPRFFMFIGIDYTYFYS